MTPEGKIAAVCEAIRQHYSADNVLSETAGSGVRFLVTYEGKTRQVQVDVPQNLFDEADDVQALRARVRLLLDKVPTGPIRTIKREE